MSLLVVDITTFELLYLQMWHVNS